MSKVSIIVPVYNVQEYVGNAVKSLVCQTYRDLEIILVDDGSTDGSGSLCDEFLKQDERIKVIHKENGGLSSARNAGLDIATGDFLLFLDADDYLCLNAVEVLVQIQKSTDADIVQFRYEHTDCLYAENFVSHTGDVEIVTDRHAFYDKLYKIGGEGASACTKFYKKDLFVDLRFKHGVLHEDEFMITDILTKPQKIAYINDNLYYYVMRGNSIIHSFSEKKLDVFVASEYRMNFLSKSGYEDLFEIEQNKYFATLVNYYCLARYYKNYEVSKKLLTMIREYYNKYSYSGCGILKILYKLCKVDTGFVWFYYILRKYFGHIEGGL